MWQSADAILGRYLNGEPNNGVFNARNLGLYSYVYQNPLRLADPDGNNPGPIYVPGVFGQANIQSGNSLVDNTVLGVVNTAANTANSVANIAVSGLAVVAGVLEPYTNELNALATMPEVGPAVAMGVKGISELAALGKAGSAVKTLATAEERANAIHAVLDPRAQRARTTAVTETQEGVRVVSSSERRLTPAQRAQLGANEVEGVGVGHAEATGINAAKGMGLTPTGTAASRPICTNCAQTLAREGVEPLSSLK